MVLCNNGRKAQTTTTKGFGWTEDISSVHLLCNLSDYLMHIEHKRKLTFMEAYVYASFEFTQK